MAYNSDLDLFIVCGESSGDVLAHSILQKLPNPLRMKGVIGPMLEKLGVSSFLSIDQFSLSGISSLITGAPRIFRLFRQIKKAILKERPKAVLLVDNAEFSLLMGRSLRKSGYTGKIIQLVAPSIWAWRANRKKTLERYFDLLLVLYPFEETLFENSPLKTHFIGHPTYNTITDYKPSPIEELKGKTVIASFPGSRRKEIALNLPLHAEAIKPLLEEDPQKVFAVAVSGEHFKPMVRAILEKVGIQATITSAPQRFDLMKMASLALAKFGTVNLELALMHTPTITTFPLPLLERVILGSVFKIYLPHYCLANILSGMRIFPEYLGPFANVKNIQSEILRLLPDEVPRKSVLSGCQYLQDLLANAKTKCPASELIYQTLS